MKINRFLATKLHGYLDFDIKFNSDLTFLTGINGSGKTTVVNSISALISPSLLFLANTDYMSMRVEIEHKGVETNITAERDVEKLTLSSSAADESICIPILSLDRSEYISQTRMRELVINYYREQEASFVNHPVFKLVKSLPTPMFLNIERRIENISFEAAPELPSRRRTQNIFRSSFSRSIL